MKIVILLIAITVTGCLAGCQPENQAQFNLQEQDPGAATGLKFANSESVQMKAIEPVRREPGTSWSTDRNTFLFTPADYRGAWSCTVDSDLIRFVILDQAGAVEVPVTADQLLVFSTDGAVFTLDPEDVDELGRTAVFSLEDRDLAFAVQLGATVQMQIDDRIYRGEIKPGNRGTDRQQ